MRGTVYPTLYSRAVEVARKLGALPRYGLYALRPFSGGGVQTDAFLLRPRKELGPFVVTSLYACDTLDGGSATVDLQGFGGARQLFGLVDLQDLAVPGFVQWPAPLYCLDEAKVRLSGETGATVKATASLRVAGFHVRDAEALLAVRRELGELRAVGLEAEVTADAGAMSSPDTYQHDEDAAPLSLERYRVRLLTEGAALSRVRLTLAKRDLLPGVVSNVDDTASGTGQLPRGYDEEGAELAETLRPLDDLELSLEGSGTAVGIRVTFLGRTLGVDECG